jgi:hypothetical protein
VVTAKCKVWDKWWMGKTFPTVCSGTVVDSILGCIGILLVQCLNHGDNWECTALLHNILAPEHNHPDKAYTSPNFFYMKNTGDVSMGQMYQFLCPMYYKKEGLPFIPEARIA